MPLMWAVKNESAPSPAVVKVLLKGKANVNATSKEKVTPLINAAQAQSSAVVEMLLEADADINATDYDGKTAIEMSFEDVDYYGDALKGFAKGMTDRKATLLDGRTFLMLAITHESESLAELVLQYKADVNQENEMKPRGASTALMIA